MMKRQRTTASAKAELQHSAMKSGATISNKENGMTPTTLSLAKRANVPSLRHLLVLLSLLLSSFAPAAEARLVGHHRQLAEQAHQDQQHIDDTHPKKVSEEFAAKYPTIAEEIRRRRHIAERQQRLQVEQDDESEEGYQLDTQDGVEIVDIARSRDLQASSTQQLTATSVNDNDPANDKPLITLTLSNQPSSSYQVSDLKATKGQSQRSAQTLDVEFVLDRTDAWKQQTSKTRFQVQINLVALAMGRTDGLSITAQEEGGEEVDGEVTGVDKLIVSEHPGDGHGGGEHGGLHLMAVAPQSKPPAPLTTIVDETILPP